MSRTLFLSLAISLIFSIALSAQKTSTARIYGQVEDAREDKITLMAYSLPFNFDPNQTVKIDEQGRFDAKVALSEGEYYYLIYGRSAQILYLNPGDELQVKFHGRRMLTSLEYQGSAKAVNDYLRKRLNTDKSVQRSINYNNQKNGIYKLPWDSYLAELRKWRQAYAEALDGLQKEQPSNTAARKRFVDLEKAHADGLYGVFYLRYPAYNAHFTKADPLGLWADMDLEMLRGLLQDDERLLHSKNYRDFLNQYVLSLSEKQFIENKTRLRDKADFVTQSYRNIPNLVTEDWQVEYLQARLLYEQIDPNGLAGMSEAVEEHRGKTFSKSVYREAVEKAWHKWASTAPGVQAPEIVGQDIEGNEVRLEDFRGKVVYIDVWATWCGPCRREIPALRATEERFHDKDVVFLSVSIDKNKGKWENMVREQGLGGTQIHIPGGWSASICKDYNISSIPRFMLIDAEGKIITTKAKRPSQGIDALLDRHLKK